MRFFNHSVFAHVKSGYQNHKKLILWSSGSVIVLALLVSGGLFAYQKVYEGRIYPNVYVAGINLGGLSHDEASDVLQNRFSTLLDKGLSLELEGETATIDLHATGSTDPDLVYNYVDVDVHEAVKQAMNVGRENEHVGHAVLTLLDPRDIEMRMTLLEDEIAADMHDAFSELEDPGIPTDYVIDIGRSDIDIEVEIGTTGQEIDTDVAIQQLKDDLRDLQLSTLTLVIAETEDIVTEEEARALEDEVIAIIEAAPYYLTHVSDAQKEYRWRIDDGDIADWLIPVRDGDNVILDLEGEALETFLQDIHNEVDVAPQNARFVIEDNKVVEFAGSLDGEIFNDDATLDELKTILGDEDMSIAITVDVDEPEISTGSVNDFGITEILGVGVSDFSGSPSNRIENIKNGASKLNGLLVPPGETISLIEQLKPFTYENGYLPELVIKGDEIKAEMGGGLCQIGTTTFRAVMNAGLEVTERRNHSLVVSYYDDLTNGNPGTDATIYDPAPDFKFTNDYDTHVLFITEVDVPNRMLYFTFWGTNDGRHGSYTPPVVLSWNGYGATQYTETDSLAPGVQRCQSPHPGASTTFDYIIEYDDDREDYVETFNSTYRSLPMICLVGAEDGGSGGGDTEDKSAEPLPDTTTPAEELEVGDVVE